MEFVCVRLVLENSSEVLDFRVSVSELSQTNAFDLALRKLKEVILLVFVYLFHLFYHMVELVNLILLNVANLVDQCIDCLLLNFYCLLDCVG